MKMVKENLKNKNILLKIIMIKCKKRRGGLLKWRESQPRVGTTKHRGKIYSKSLKDFPENNLITQD